MLCEAAHHAHRPTHPLNPHFARVTVRRGYKTAVVAVAHRLCRILFAMLRDGSDFDPARIGVEEGHFTRATTYKYRFTPKPAGRCLPLADPREDPNERPRTSARPRLAPWAPSPGNRVGPRSPHRNVGRNDPQWTAGDRSPGSPELQRRPKTGVPRGQHLTPCLHGGQVHTIGIGTRRLARQGR